MFEDGRRSVSARLREHGSAAWAAATNHPMVNEIATGALPHPRFRHYFEQNIAFLGDYTRALGAITAKAPDADAIDVLGRLLAQIITVELPANRRFLERLGGDPAAVRDATTMEPATYAYTRHLLATAALGDCAEGLAAVLPCQWSYGEIGAQISGARPDDPIYADWIGVFGNTEYAGLVDLITALLDRLAPPDVAGFRRLRAVFEASTRYEVEFWDMAYEPLASRT